MFFFVFEINSCADGENCDTYHYHEKAFHLYSSLIGVIKTANVNIITAITIMTATVKRFMVFSAKSIIAPSVVSKYFTRSKSKLASFPVSVLYFL